MAVQSTLSPPPPALLGYLSARRGLECLSIEVVECLPIWMEETNNLLVCYVVSSEIRKDLVPFPFGIFSNIADYKLQFEDKGNTRYR